MGSKGSPTSATSKPESVGMIDAFTELVERLWQYVHEADDLPEVKTPMAVVREPQHSTLIERAE